MIARSLTPVPAYIRRYTRATLYTMQSTLTVLIIGSQREAGKTGTVDVRDGKIVTQAPDGIGRADRILVTLDDGRTCWTLRNELVIVE